MVISEVAAGLGSGVHLGERAWTDAEVGRMVTVHSRRARIAKPGKMSCKTAKSWKL
jgi:hypothetical protein